MKQPTRSKQRPLEFSDDLEDEIRLLRDEVIVLRQAIDELREDFRWAVLNGRIRYMAAEPFHLTSMPLDPTDPQFAEKLNRVTFDDLPPDVAATQ